MGYQRIGNTIIKKAALKPDTMKRFDDNKIQCPPDKQLIGDKNPMMAKIVIETLAQTLLATDEFNKAIVKFTELLDETHKFRKNIHEEYSSIRQYLEQDTHSKSSVYGRIISQLPRNTDGYNTNKKLHGLYSKIPINDSVLVRIMYNEEIDHNWKSDKRLYFSQWINSRNEKLTHDNLLKYLYSKMPNLYIFDPAKSIEDFTKLNINEVIRMKEVINDFYTIYMPRYEEEYYNYTSEILKLKEELYNTCKEFNDYYTSVRHNDFPLFNGITDHESKLFKIIDQYESCYNQYKKALNDFTEECDKYSDQLDRLIASSKKSIPTYQSRAVDLMQYAKTL